MPSVANLSLPGTTLPGAVTVTIADGDALKKQIAQYVATIAKACTKDRFVVALSGGSMPKLLTGLLDLDVDWSKWDVFFADERCVPLDSNDSNYKACEDHLFSKISGPKPTIHTLDTSLSPAQAAEKYGDELNSVGRRFDLCLLGMGPDGHTVVLLLSILLSRIGYIVAGLLGMGRDGHTVV